MKNNSILYKTYCLTCKQPIYHPEVVEGMMGIVKIIDHSVWSIYSHIPTNHYILQDMLLRYQIATCVSYDNLKSVIDKIEERVEMHPKKKDGEVV